MSRTSKAKAVFATTIADAYKTDGPAIELGQGVHDGELAKASPLYAKYGTRTDAQSAREMLADRIAQATTPGAPGGKAPDRERRRRAPGRERANWVTSSTRRPASRCKRKRSAESSGS
jgi:hypothetical protein